MTRHRRFVGIVWIMLLGGASVLSTVGRCAEEGFTSLFNGKDLSGWHVMGNAADWEAKDGILIAKGGHGFWLRSEKEYEDFVWRLEFRVFKEGDNSGMFIRATERGNPAFTGMELQILGDVGKQPTVHTCCALYASVAPSKNMSKPYGEWNEVEITCKGRQLTEVWNGEKVLDVNLDDDSVPFQEKKLSERARKGYIGLQDHGSRVEFRNLRIKELKAGG